MDQPELHRCFCPLWRSVERFFFLSWCVCAHVALEGKSRFDTLFITSRRVYAEKSNYQVLRHLVPNGVLGISPPSSTSKWLMRWVRLEYSLMWGLKNVQIRSVRAAKRRPSSSAVKVSLFETLECFEAVRSPGQIHPFTSFSVFLNILRKVIYKAERVLFVHPAFHDWPWPFIWVSVCWPRWEEKVFN